MNPKSLHQNAPIGSNSLALLPANFAPGPYDVICQRGKECYNHAGNTRFRGCIEKNLEQYVKATSRQKKAIIVTEIIAAIREKQPCAGFIRKDLLTRRWYQVQEKEAREKVGQAFRDALKVRRSITSRGIRSIPKVRNALLANSAQHDFGVKGNQTQFESERKYDPNCVVSSVEVQDPCLTGQNYRPTSRTPSPNASHLSEFDFDAPPISVLSSSIQALDYAGNRRNVSYASEDVESNQRGMCSHELGMNDGAKDLSKPSDQKTQRIYSVSSNGANEVQASLANSAFTALHTVSRLGSTHNEAPIPTSRNVSETNCLFSSQEPPFDWSSLLKELEMNNEHNNAIATSFASKLSEVSRSRSSATMQSLRNYGSENLSMGQTVLAKSSEECCANQPEHSADVNQLLLALEPRPLPE